MSESASGEADSSTGSNDKESSVEYTCDNCGNEFTTHAGYTKHIREICTDEGYKCPTCGLQHVTERGVMAHHSQVHDEKLHPKIQCEHCGDEFFVEPHREDSAKYCSDSCNAKAAENWITVPRVDIECKYCGDSFTVPRYESERATYCSIECRRMGMSESMKGEKNPAWKGGGGLSYGPNWTAKRNRVRERDNYRCQSCGKHEDDLMRGLDVHHIIPRRDFDDLSKANKIDNLVSLCSPCHRKWEGVPIKPTLLND